MLVEGLHHVEGLLGIPEVPKPPTMAFGNRLELLEPQRPPA